MKQSRLIKFLWSIIGVLLIGFIIVTVIALNRAQAIDQARTSAQGSIDSLKEQVRQAKAGAKPTATPLVESTANTATPTPSPTPTPKATATPKTK